MIRVSTVMSLTPPSLRNERSSSTCSSLAWSGSFSSPISSRYSVPPDASSNIPFLVARASVNAPFSCPNSSDSSSVSGSAAQLTWTNGSSRRALASWMAFAMRSLPVPLSPSSSTAVALLAATFRITVSAPSSAGDLPTIGLARGVGLAGAGGDLAQPLGLEAVAEGDAQGGEVDRLPEEVGQPQPEPADRVVDVAVRGDHHDGGVRVERLDLP